MSNQDSARTIASVSAPTTRKDVTRWLEAYNRTRAFTERLCKPLTVEDHVVQSMPDASPTRWHLAHTSWFYETFLLKPFLPGYALCVPEYETLFNSYYNSVGPQWTKAKRGILSRPTVEEIYRYRRCVDENITRLFTEHAVDDSWGAILTVGLHHEMQHQELILTDVKHAFGCNPLHPVYSESPVPTLDAAPLNWLAYEGGLVEIGQSGVGQTGDRFCYDNEGPRHRVHLQPYFLASRPVTNAEFMAFMSAGGYTQPEWWLSEGWQACREENWRAPLYWEQSADDGVWRQMTLGGLRPVDPHEPVCHVSYFEADAYARWIGYRLPREEEWENAANECERNGNLADNGLLHPRPATPSDDGRPVQMFGDVWEWTGSPYGPYPGYRQPKGAFGEYNGKFMCNQMVLRGGSCATPHEHIRATYRNFFHATARWQFSGIRLARDEV